MTGCGPFCLPGQWRIDVKETSDFSVLRNCLSRSDLLTGCPNREMVYCKGSVVRCSYLMSALTLPKHPWHPGDLLVPPLPGLDLCPTVCSRGPVLLQHMLHYSGLTSTPSSQPSGTLHEDRAALSWPMVSVICTSLPWCLGLPSKVAVRCLLSRHSKGECVEGLAFPGDPRRSQCWMSE